MLWRIRNFQSLMVCQCPQYSKIHLHVQLNLKSSPWFLPAFTHLGRDLSSLSWLSNILLAWQAQLEGQLFCSWNKSHGLQEKIQPFCEPNFLAAQNLLEEFAKMLDWIWERNMFPVVLVDSAGLAVFSSCSSGPVVLASCLAGAQLALSIFVTDQAVPWQISQPLPLFVNHLI